MRVIVILTAKPMAQNAFLCGDDHNVHDYEVDDGSDKRTDTTQRKRHSAQQEKAHR